MQLRKGRAGRGDPSGITWFPVVLLGLLLLLAGSPALAQNTPGADLRGAALEHVNRSREDAGLPVLRSGDVLDKSARKHARDMLSRDYYSHVTPEGNGPRQRFLDAGGDRWELVAENIAKCRNCGALDAERVAAFHEGWMNSPEHRANILHDGMARFGFGAASGDGVVYAVQTFAGPGSPRGEETSEIEPGAVSGVALDVLNVARREAGVPSLTANPALTEAAGKALPEDLGGFRLEELEVFGDPAQQDLRGFGRLQALVGECGGCGRVPTAGDVRAFIRDWLDDDVQRQSIVYAGVRHVGMALRSDGTGRKVAILLLGSRP